MSTTEDNMALARSCFEHAPRGELDAFDRLLTSDYVMHNPQEFRGPDGLREMVEGYREVVGGLNVTVDHQFAEGDHVATRFTVRGTHDGELMGTAATGREVEFTGITISRCRDGRIAEEWEITDALGLLAQIGALPEMAHE
jgi:predicted ester cyclase